MVSEFLSGMTRTSPKPHLMGLSVTNKPLIDEVNYQFARRIVYVASTTGETAHVERWNNTLRQGLARFVRLTLSFSKLAIMHEACLLLFLHCYNRERAILFK